MSSNPEEITFFAQTDARGENIPFGIKAKDRTRHVYVIGKTGMGKSTLLENMAVQDIKNGNGLAFIDPHGQTAELLLDYIPESRKDDVLYFAPFDTDNPVSFNVMEDVEPDRRHLVVSGLMSVFKKIWVDAWSARMEYILSNTLLALLEYPGSTLLGVNRMLSDKVYRKKVIDNIKDPSVRSFWVDEFLKYNEKYMQEAGDAIKNKTGQFTANPLIRNIVGQSKSSFDIRKMMDEKKILIVNLSKGLVGETNANLLGSMITTRLYLAAMSRADMTQEQMKAAPNFYFYVDEFQSFANATFANILSEARKYKLNLTIAHQYIEQMEEEVRDAVFGNVGTLITFRVGPFDAEVLETVFTPKFLAPDIVNLGFTQIYLTLMIDGIGSQPFSATTLPPIKPSSISCKEIVIQRSREQFSKKRADVEQAINEWHGHVTALVVPKKEVASEPLKQETTKEVSEQAPVPPQRATVAPAPRVALVPEEVKGLRQSVRFEVRSEPAIFEKKEPRNEREIVRAENRDSTPRRRDGGDTKKMTPARTEHGTSKPRELRESRDSRDFSSSKRSETPTPNKKQFTDAVSSSKNLEDLRSVLRNMTSGSEKKVADTTPQNTEPKKEVSKLEKLENVVEKKVVPQIEVSSLPAIASMFTPRSVVEKKVASDVVHVSSAVPNVSSVNQEEVVSVSTNFSSSNSKTEESQMEDPLSPRKLERMMRVTGNDKTPLG